MDKKQMLLDLIEKNRDTLCNNRDYIICNQVLRKIDAFTLVFNDDVINLDFSEINNLSELERSVFTSNASLRILDALKVLSTKKGWRVETVNDLINRLKQDIIDNKMKLYKTQLDNFDELSRIVRERLFQENYKIVLDLIKDGVEKNLLSYEDAAKLNFYILKECSSNTKEVTNDEDDLLINLIENTESASDIRMRLQEVFSKYGYTYDADKFGELDADLVRYVNVDYADYVLSKFKEYNISNNEIYVRKRVLYRILIDRDKEVFDSIIKFVDLEQCTLSMLLSMPSIFVRRKKKYIETNKFRSDNSESVIEISGANQDFLENISLYKQLSGINVLQDMDLERIGKFLCTPSVIVRRNLLLLRRYGIISNDELPKAIVALCGMNTEYIIDRFIEVDLYDSYLIPRVTPQGEVKPARGTSILDGDNNPTKFYKLKRAIDFGDSIFASNAGIRKNYTNDDVEYMGISRVRNEDGLDLVKQDSLPLSYIMSVSTKFKEELPEMIKRRIASSRISEEAYFDNLYRYKEVSPLTVFATSDEEYNMSLKGDKINAVFDEDYKRVLTDTELMDVSTDSFIKILDNAIYCDSEGYSKNIKKDDLRYVFYHPSFHNVRVVVSRNKVLRLCKKLKDYGAWINENSSNIDKENTLLSVILKDMIVSEVEVLMLRMAIRSILVNGLIKVPEIKPLTDVTRRVR